MTAPSTLSAHDSQLSILLPRFISSLVNVPFRALSLFRSTVYNVLILKMTTKWYQVVLEKLEPNSIVLDIGIGTAGALIRCQSLLKSKNIRVVGVDYDAHYVSVAQTAIANQGLENYISVVTMSVYDVQTKQSELTVPGAKKGESSPHQFDAVYFSGSFSLLPDMVGAIQVVAPLLLLQPPNSGKIYITQTYQRQFPMLLSYMKPLLRFLTTIDFGQLVTEQDAEDLFYRQIQVTCGMDVLEHKLIDRSVNTSIQAAYLTVLQGNKNN